MIDCFFNNKRLNVFHNWSLLSYIIENVINFTINSNVIKKYVLRISFGVYEKLGHVQRERGRGMHILETSRPVKEKFNTSTCYCSWNKHWKVIFSI